MNRLSKNNLLPEAAKQSLKHGKEKDRLTLLRQAKGVWKNRHDLPEPRELRDELDRFCQGREA
jgi:hypothetical protein